MLEKMLRGRLVIVIMLAFIFIGGTGVYYYQNLRTDSAPFVFSEPELSEKFAVDESSEETQQEPLSTLPSTPLPSQHLITTPFIPQAPEKNWDQPWQDACEEAALLTVHYYYQQRNPSIAEIRQDILDLIEYQTGQGMGYDVDLFEMAQVAQDHLYYSTQVLDNPTVEQIKSFLLKNIPVVAPANGKTLFKENKHFKDGGPYYHSLVILGYDEGKRQFIVHDVGTQFGKNFRYTYNTLMEAIHDFPESRKKEDINQGDKRILILLPNSN